MMTVEVSRAVVTEKVSSVSAVVRFEPASSSAYGFESERFERPVNDP